MTEKTAKEGFPYEAKSYRLCLGLTQAEMAKQFGMAPSTYGNWERGVCLPSLKHFSELSQRDTEGAEFLADAYMEQKLEG